MEHAPLLQVLADPTRMRLIELLLQRNYCVSALANAAGISAPAVSQHLKQCQQAGLVRSEKIGYHTHYQVNREILRQLSREVSQLADITTQPCEIQNTHCHHRNGHCACKLKSHKHTDSDK